ncbi:MAG TPA: magnesium/cobalt transporter CorA [Candidatus Eisenbacteria bacterium]|nr:magnesium/cobalt transporter CorA [Candidatus Eisenbacteria bacterium]
MEEMNVIYTNYNVEEFARTQLSNLDNLVLPDDKSVKWLEIPILNNIDLIEKIGHKFDIHPLVIEDILSKDHMPKIEKYEHYLFLILKDLKLLDNGELITEQFSFILFKDLVISFQPAYSNTFSALIARMSEGSIIRKNGADVLLHALTDTIVDNYFIIVEKIGEKIDLVEDDLLTNLTKEMLQEIYKLKRNLIYIKKTLWPMRNIMSSISKNEFELIDDKTLYYFRDIHDHIIQMIDIIESYREICSGLLDTYLSSISNKTNDIMKVLTIFSTIFIPLTFLAGVYGMNFKYLPELNWKYGYASFWIISALLIGFMLRYFRKKDWI